MHSILQSIVELLILVLLLSRIPHDPRFKTLILKPNWKYFILPFYPPVGLPTCHAALLLWYNHTMSDRITIWFFPSHIGGLPWRTVGSRLQAEAGRLPLRPDAQHVAQPARVHGHGGGRFHGFERHAVFDAGEECLCVSYAQRDM